MAQIFLALDQSYTTVPYFTACCTLCMPVLLHVYSTVERIMSHVGVHDGRQVLEPGRQLSGAGFGPGGPPPNGVFCAAAYAVNESASTVRSCREQGEHGTEQGDSERSVSRATATWQPAAGDHGAWWGQEGFQVAIRR